MSCGPTDRLLVAKVAVLDELIGALPSNTPEPEAPSKKETSPGGMPPPGGTAAMVAVKVTVWPNGQVAGEALRLMVVTSRLTTKVGGLSMPVLPDSWLLPENTALMVCEPTANDEVEKAAS